MLIFALQPSVSKYMWLIPLQFIVITSVKLHVVQSTGICLAIDQ